jgi:hypothetical protein
MVDSASYSVYDSCMQHVSPSPFFMVVSMSDRELCARHFCYICGGLIVKSALGSEIDEAVSSHFGKDCQLFAVPT